MCGLVGVFSKSLNGFTQEMRDAFSTLLMIDTLRGEDSTGAFMIHQNGDVDLLKEASTGGEFLRTKAWKKMHTDSWQHGAALIGHNRKATKGSITDENAHPFVVDDKIVLVHNGGIFGDHKHLADVAVDSHAIAHLIRENEVEEALGKFWGAYALIWYDVENEEVHIIRNKDRPLWWMETDNAWMWASEKAMLMFTAARCGLKVKQGPILLDEDTLNTFALRPGGGWQVSHRKVTINRDWDTSNNKQAQTGSPGGPLVLVPDNSTSVNDNLFDSWPEKMQRDISLMDDDIPFDACALPQDRRTLGTLNEDFLCTVGSNSWEKTSEFERSMAEKCNKVLTLGEFNHDIPSTYTFGKKVRCSCFEYTDDGDGGYYMYSSPLDDTGVIFRHHFGKETKPDHNRMMQMALNEWTMDFKVEKKCWAPLRHAEKEQNARQEGYCVITSNGAEIIEGGGFKDGRKIKEKMNAS